MGVVVLLLFREALGGAGLYQRDIHAVWLAQSMAVARCLAAGAWPLWNPWFGFGEPLLANPTAQLLYPPAWLAILLPVPTGYDLYVILHVWLGGLGAFCLARRLALGPSGAALAGLCYALSGPLLSLANVWHHLAGAALLPWTALAGEALGASPRGRGIALGGALALQVLAGSPDMAAMAAAAALFLVLRPRDDRAGWKRMVPALARSAAVASLLSAAQWLPTLELAWRSARAGWGLTERLQTFWSLHPAGLSQVLLPLPAGAIAHLFGLEGEMEVREPFLGSVYLGMAAAPLVLWSLVRGGRAARLAGGVLLLLVALALGRHLPLFAWLKAAVPFVGVFRYPIKIMVLAALAWALLAGAGLQAWGGDQRLLGPALSLLTPLAALALAAGGLAMPLGPPLCALLSGVLLVALRARALPWVVALAAADLLTAHRPLNPTAPPAFFHFRPAVLEALAEPAPHRVFVWDYQRPLPGRPRPHPELLGEVVQTADAYPSSLAREIAFQMYLYPPAAARWAILGSYDGDLLGLSPPALRDLGALLEAGEGTPAFARLLRLGSVDSVVSLHELNDTGLEAQAQVAGQLRRPILVSRVRDTLPKAFLAGGARPVDPPDAYGVLVAPDFDPARELVVPAGHPARAAQAGGSARVADARPDRLLLEVEAAGPATLVVTTTWDPGWKARIDGAPTQTLPANVLFLGVPVPKGRHAVELRYRPHSVALGMSLSAAGLLVLGLAAARSRPAA
jgi:hypothetical protein